MNQKNPQIAVTEPEKQLELTVFASLLPVVAGLAARKNNVSRQPSNSRRREGTFKGPRGIQAPDRREVWRPILHHLARWEGCSSVSLRGVAAGGDRWARPVVDTCAAQRFCRDQGRSGGRRQLDVPRGAEHRGLQEGHRREPVHV